MGYLRLDYWNTLGYTWYNRKYLNLDLDKSPRTYTQTPYIEENDHLSFSQLTNRTVERLRWRMSRSIRPKLFVWEWPDWKQSDLPCRKLTESRDFPRTLWSTSTIAEEADVGEPARSQGPFQWEREAELEHWKAWSARQRGLKLWVNTLVWFLLRSGGHDFARCHEISRLRLTNMDSIIFSLRNNWKMLRRCLTIQAKWVTVFYRSSLKQFLKTRLLFFCVNKFLELCWHNIPCSKTPSSASSPYCKWY